MQTGNLKEKYTKEIKNKLKISLGKKSLYEVPALTKIVVNASFGKSSPDSKMRDKISENIAKITGQKPIFTTARKAISGFKTRKGQIIGVKATLRGDRMYVFFEKLVTIVLPRLRDFRGLGEKSFDGRGNYSLGFREINIFPEIDYYRGDKSFGLEVTISTSAKTDEEASALLAELGMPFSKQKKSTETVKIAT